MIYSNLVNSHRPGVEAIQHVLARTCIEVEITKQGSSGTRKAFQLRPTAPQSTDPVEVQVTLQPTLFGSTEMVSHLSHDETILLLAQYGTYLGFDFHIGETEQRKNRQFREMSTQMLVPSDYGLAPGPAFNTIKEIDILFLKDNYIRAAWEVTTSIDTARVAINDRYRNLFTVLPNLFMPALIVVRDPDARKAFEWLYSQANVKDGYADRIRIARMSELTEVYMETIFK